MHVLHITPCLAPAWACGPLADRIAQLARAQASAGTTVTVLTTDTSAPHERLPSGVHVEHGVRVERVRSVNSSSRWSVGLTLARGFRQRVRALAPGATVLHLHELRTLENVHAAEATRAPLVLSLHGGLAPGHVRPWAARAWDWRWGRGVLARVRHVIVDTDADARLAREAWSARGLVLPAEAVSTLAPPALDARTAAHPPEAWAAYAAQVQEIYGRAEARG